MFIDDTDSDVDVDADSEPEAVAEPQPEREPLRLDELDKATKGDYEIN